MFEQTVVFDCFSWKQAKEHSNKDGGMGVFCLLVIWKVGKVVNLERLLWSHFKKKNNVEITYGNLFSVRE